MVGELQPLSNQQRIVNMDGTPNDYFIRWAQQRQIDIGDGITAAQALAIVQQFMLDHPLIAGSGITLTPNGNIADDITIAADVQAILDQISTTWGAVLFRGTDDWQALAPGTAGNFLKTNGPGADPAWAAAGGGGGNYAKIAQIVVAAAQATLDFTAIPATYEDLILMVNGRGTAAATFTTLNLQFNGDTGANYDRQNFQTYGNATAASELIGTTGINFGEFTGASAPTGDATAAQAVMPAYARTVFFKLLDGSLATKWGNGGFNFGRYNLAGTWRNTVAINRCTLSLAAGNFDVGTVATLYGRG